MSNGISNPLSLTEATSVINEYASAEQTDWVYTAHADQRGEQRNICQTWLRKALEEGKVIDVRMHTLKSGNIQYRYRESYKDKFGETVVITVVPKAYRLVIITQW
ncbi:MAG: DNA recombination-dependent growth factor C [Phenylobacterium sp.]|jgi:DNA recombination-dependent growth factor C